ncbi:MAG: cell division protein ZapD [Gammaproteobacteria bacterium]|nr:cell division protein ZapD [Gammaproteobacteria bacterium]
MTEKRRELVAYEQPLSERIRTFLRLEHLFGKARHELEGSDPWSSRATIEALIDMMTVLGRSDFKQEIIKELERHATTLQGLERNPRVDAVRLQQVLNQVREHLARLKVSAAFGQELRDDELLSAVRQRSTIPAGTCGFDLPVFHHWLQSPRERRARDLREWLHAFDLLSDSVTLCLQLVRESALATSELASAGFFQRSLESSTPCHMIRVLLPAGAEHFPEISAGKHRFTVRFMTLGETRERPTQVTDDVSFELHCCVI